MASGSQEANVSPTFIGSKLDRRELLTRAAKAGIAAPAVAALARQSPGASAAPTSSAQPHIARHQETSGIFTVVIIDGSGDIDPHSTYTTIGSLVCLGCYEMLIQYQGESTSEYAPMLAESWEASPDGASYTFKIPANATFQDGSICDANAVRQSFVRFHQLQMGPYLVLDRFVTDVQTQIVAVDATTLQFNLPKPEPLFLAAMASTYGPFVVSPAAVEANKTEDDPWAHEWFLSNAVGTGPYRLVQNDIKEQIVFEKFEEYHGGWVGNHFDQIVLRVVPENATRRQLIEQGDADASTNNLTPEDVDALKSVSGVTVLTYPTTRVDWYILNAAKLNAQARQGLSYVYPYDNVIQGAYRGLIARTGPIATTVRGYDPAVFLYPTDLTKAKELLIAGGLAEGSTIDLLIGSEDEIDKSAAQLFQASLSEIGYTLEINTVDTSTLDDIIFGDQPAEEKPMVIGSWAWWPDYNDPWNQLAPNFLASQIGDGGGNAGAWTNDQFEALMEQAKNFTDDAQLNELMRQIQDILTQQDPAAIYIGERQYYTALRSDILGFQPNPLYLECFNFFGMSRGPAS